MDTGRHDLAIRWEIVETFDAEPRLAQAALGVGVEAGVVALTGIVGCGAEAIEAERLARRVDGVREVIPELQVLPLTRDRVTDVRLSSRALDVLDWFLPGEITGLEVAARAGWLIVTGKVAHHHVKEDAADLLRRLKGVVGLDNRLAVTGAADPARVRDTLKAALQRRADARAESLRVDVLPEGRVTVTGDLAPDERRVALTLARAAPRAPKRGRAQAWL
jgi:osmotically-inducible protein OsmY